MIFRTYGCPELMVVQILWLSWSYDCPDLMVVHILWLSKSYDCPDLIIVQYSCMLSFRSYGCPDLMVVHILWLSTSYGCPVKINILWLYLMVSYGCPMKKKILWFDLMVVHVDGCPVDGCPLTSRIALWCQKVKPLPSQWVTGVGIELSQTKVWTAKNIDIDIGDF